MTVKPAETNFNAAELLMARLRGVLILSPLLVLLKAGTIPLSEPAPVSEQALACDWDPFGIEICHTIYRGHDLSQRVVG